MTGEKSFRPFCADSQPLEMIVAGFMTMLVVTSLGGGDNGDRRADRCHRVPAKCVNAAADKTGSRNAVSRLLAAQIQGRRATAGSGHLLTANQSPWL